MTLRIALLAPLVSAIREPQIGGVATLITDLAAGLQEAGLEVDLFAASGSQVDGLNIVDTGVNHDDLAATLFRPLGPRPSTAARQGGFLAEEAFEAAYALIAARGYDIVHNHAFDAPAITLATSLKSRVMHTLHLPPDASISNALREAAGSPRPPIVAAVSASQRAAWERHNHIDVLLEAGVPTRRIPWSARAGPDLLFAGRLSPEKGTLEAIQVARETQRHLLIAGGRYDPAHADAVEEAARGVPGVTLVGALPRMHLWELMTRCGALIFPIRWEEPFGLVTAEAQAAGCPVIGFGLGALSEVVVDGLTGGVLKPGDIAGAARAVSAIEMYDRAACRRHAEENLDIAPMIAAHVELYRRLAGSGSGAADPVSRSRRR